MKQVLLSFCIILTLSFATASNSQAQTAELLGGNVLNGAITGTILGAATMGLQNSDDITPLRIGLGSGIIGGAGIAAYDVITLPAGQQFFISGMFNDGNNSSVIILLDTFYGVAGGAVLGSAVILIGNNPLLEGLQYGASIGAWAGFGIGLIDSFVTAERNQDFVAEKLLNKNSLLEFNQNGLELGLIQPDLISYKDLSGNALSVDIKPALKVFSLRASF
ncbi:MAG: hypothetical protein WEA56_03355 [Balneolaceae bacterium]